MTAELAPIHVCCLQGMLVDIIYSASPIVEANCVKPLLDAPLLVAVPSLHTRLLFDSPRLACRSPLHFTVSKEAASNTA